MYNATGSDKVAPLDGIPQSSVGAPIPIVLAGEHDVCVAYYVEGLPEGSNHEALRAVGTDSEGEAVAIVRFSSCYAHSLGPPNDEAFQGHPLSPVGLEPYGSFEVHHSSWIKQLARMNSVHPYHDEKRFLSGRRHFILSFHDTTFECIAKEYSVAVVNGSVRSAVSLMLEALR